MTDSSDLSSLVATCDVDSVLLGEHYDQATGHVVPIIISACLDPQAGGLQWRAEPAARDDPRTLGQLRTWFPPMLNDSVRNQMWQDAISSAVASFVEEHGRAPLVLDVGTGTGLLAMLAARAGAAAVIALEQFPALATLAQQTIADNHLGGCIRVIAKSSRTLIQQDIDNAVADVFGTAKQVKFDIVVSELLDYTLLGEGILPAMHDISPFCTDQVICIPHGATFRLTPLRGQSFDRFRIECAKIEECIGVQGSWILANVERIGEPFWSHFIDFSPKATTSTRHLNIELQFDTDAFLFDWEVLLSPNGSVYSNATDSGQPFQNHWSQGLYVLAEAATATIQVQINETQISLISRASTTTSSDDSGARSYIKSYGGHLRIWAMKKSQQELMTSVSSVTLPSKAFSVLFLSDNVSLLAQLVQHLATVDHDSVSVVIYAPFQPTFAFISTALASYKPPDGIQVRIWRGADAGETWDPSWPSVELVVSDGFDAAFHSRPLEGWLNSFAVIQACRPVFGLNCIILPTIVHVFCALFASDELYHAYKTVDEACSLDHTKFANLQRTYSHHQLHLPLHQFAGKIQFAPSVVVAVMDMTKGEITNLSSEAVSAQCKWDQPAHGFCCWAQAIPFPQKQQTDDDDDERLLLASTLEPPAELTRVFWYDQPQRVSHFNVHITPSGAMCLDDLGTNSSNH